MRLRLQICASTNLLSFTARWTLKLVEPRLRLRELPVDDLRGRRQLGVIYRNASYLPPAALRLIALLRQMFPRPSRGNGKPLANH